MPDTEMQDFNVFVTEHATVKYRIRAKSEEDVKALFENGDFWLSAEERDRDTHHSEIVRIEEFAPRR
jgi:hypothetical protein